MSTKTCTKCGETKPLDDYHRDRRSPDGRASKCKTCKNARNRYRQEANREERNARNRAYHHANREERNARNRAYHQANREEINARVRAYREANREKVNAKDRAYRAENREEINTRNRARREELNQATISAATRTGEPWTTEEDHYLTTTSDTAAEAAFNLSRTYESIATRRKRLRRDADQ